MCFPTLTTEVRAESEFWFKLKGTVDEKTGVVSYPLSADSCGIKNFNEPFLLIMVFLLFNIADWIGRSLNQFKLGLNRENSGNRLLIASLSRIIFAFLFVMCNVTGVQTGFFASDLVYFMVMLAFGVSSGYVGGLCMEFTPGQLTKENDRARASGFAFNCLSAGLIFGSILSGPAKSWLLNYKNEAIQEVINKEIATFVVKCYESCQ